MTLRPSWRARSSAAASSAPTEARSLRRGIGGDAPYKQIVGARLEDQGADEPAVFLRHPDLHVAHDDCIVGEQGQRLDTEEGAVLRIGRPLQSEQGCQIGSLRPPQSQAGRSEQARLRHSVKPPSEKMAEPVM